MCDEEQPVLGAGPSSGSMGAALEMIDGGLCFCLCHLGSNYLTAAEMHRRPECHVYVQPKDVCHVLFLGGYRQLHQSHKTLFSSFVALFTVWTKRMGVWPFSALYVAF